MPWVLGYAIDFDLACQYAREHALCPPETRGRLPLFSATLGDLRKRGGYPTESTPGRMCWVGEELHTVFVLHEMNPRGPEDFCLTFRKMGSQKQIVELANALGTREQPRWYMTANDWSRGVGPHFVPGLSVRDFRIAARKYMSTSCSTLVLDKYLSHDWHNRRSRPSSSCFAYVYAASEGRCRPIDKCYQNG
jgi:hypothetical protein